MVNPSEAFYTISDYQAEARSYRWFGWKSPTHDELESIRQQQPIAMPSLNSSAIVNRAPTQAEASSYIHKRWEPYLGPLNPAERQRRQRHQEI